jgi:hypothetical protein
VSIGHEVGSGVPNVPLVDVDGEGIRIKLGQRAAELAGCACDQDAEA